MKRRIVITVIGVVFLILCVISVFLAIHFSKTPRLPDYPSFSSVENSVNDEKKEYKSPIDFKNICKDAPDVIAWLNIPKTDISYPIVFREDDNSYYLRKDIYGNYHPHGSLYIENYNEPDFNDPVTVIYGHHLNTGEMFGKLQEIYTNSETFFEHNEFTIYFPEKELHYRVFCAVPLDNSHILYYHNFNNRNIFENFFKDVYNTRSLLAVFDKDIVISPDDKVVMLSTCFETDYSRRFVVMAVCSEK